MTWLCPLLKLFVGESNGLPGHRYYGRQLPSPRHLVVAGLLPGNWQSLAPHLLAGHSPSLISTQLFCCLPHSMSSKVPRLIDALLLPQRPLHLTPLHQPSQNQKKNGGPCENGPGSWGQLEP